jgi:hypothetical protein
MGLHNSYDLPDVLHLHHFVDIEAHAKRLLEAADHGHVPHRIPSWDIAWFAFDSYGLRVDIKSRFEGSLHRCQNSLHLWLVLLG